MVEQLATPQTCAVRDLDLGDQIEIRDFAGGPRVVRGGTKISADTMELKLEDTDGHIAAEVVWWNAGRGSPGVPRLPSH
jgi:hypothetical protein